MVIDNMLVYHFVDPDLRVETFFKRDDTAENGGVDFEIGDIGTSAHLTVEENFIQILPALLLFFGDKKYLLKALLTCTFIPPLLSSKSRKKYTLRLLLTCLDRGAGGRAFLFSWERLGGG